MASGLDALKAAQKTVKEQAAQAGNSMPVPSNEKKAESKADKFRRLANRRVPAAIKYIGYIANLGNKTQYDFTDDQKTKILSALNQAVDACEVAFSGKPQVNEQWSV